MDALNEKEKTVALVKFLGMFLLTLIVVMVAAFFGLKSPSKQVDALLVENARLKNTSANLKSVVITLDSLRAKMGRFNNDANKVILERQIADEINALGKYSLSDSSETSVILSRVGAEFQDHLADKKMLSEAGNCSGKVAELNAEMVKLTQELKDCNKELDTKSLQIRMMDRP